MLKYKKKLKINDEGLKGFKSKLDQLPIKNLYRNENTIETKTDIKAHPQDSHDSL